VKAEMLETLDIPAPRSEALTKCPVCGETVQQSMQECPSCVRSPERFKWYSGKIKTMRYSALARELIRIGRKDRPDTASASFYLRIAYRPTRVIGKELNRLGRLNMMKRAYAQVTDALGPGAARELDMAWNGIGRWLG